MLKQLLGQHWRPLALGFFLLVLGRATTLAAGASSKFLLDDVIGGGRPELLLPMGAVVLLATIVIAGAAYALASVVGSTAQRAIETLRCRLLEHALALPLDFYDGTRAGAIVPRVLHDPEGVSNIVGSGVIQLVGGIVTGLLGTTLLFYLDGRLAALTVTALALYAVPNGYWLARLRALFASRAELLADTSGRIAEVLGGIRTVRLHDATGTERRALDAAMAAVRAITIRSIRSAAALASFTTIVAGAIGVAVLFLGGRAVVAGTLTPGELVWFAVTAGLVARPLNTVASAGTQLAQSLAGLDRARDFLRLERERAALVPRAHVAAVRGDVTFEQVSFRYRGGGSDALHGLSYHAAAGTTTVVLGASGAGKSTLLSLLMALHVPAHGRILVDGVDLARWEPHAFRQQVAAVLADAPLLHGTIAENIACARPDATARELRAAADVACAAAFIDALPLGYDTPVGERGVRLSSGQRQRIALARAVLREPRILLLDEPTAHLDPQTEADLDRALTKFANGRTTFLATHRVAAVQRADQVLVLEHGRATVSEPALPLSDVH